jgi:hypothetical protein
VNSLHASLIRHELGHALVGTLSGLRVKRVWAPPPPDFDGPPDDPHAPAGQVQFIGRDKTARTLCLLGGLLANGDAPDWPIKPRPYSSDDRELARLVNEEDEVTYLELVRDAKDIIESAEFTRMNMLASELLAHPPHELGGRQLNDIKATVMNHGRKHFLSALPLPLNW